MNTAKMLATSTLAVAAISAATLFTATSALAQEATSDAWMQAPSLKTRAQVGTELAQARASGLTRAWSSGYIEPLRSSQPRATVKADTARALASGEIAAINAEVYGFAPVRPVLVSQHGKR